MSSSITLAFRKQIKSAHTWFSVVTLQYKYSATGFFIMFCNKASNKGRLKGDNYVTIRSFSSTVTC